MVSFKIDKESEWDWDQNEVYSWQKGVGLLVMFLLKGYLLDYPNT